ncbi:hypothetical protein J2S41_002456 [Catenuloplanes atrovinosus]|uniref:Uncharacterized protein n=2 Tax=Catenuloplanes atrovinosus TaxID=137266 RepID=A0AAE3YKU8_9ACTN|nr:hypothetical protein [Catenuloplanes atrovinosus]
MISVLTAGAASLPVPVYLLLGALVGVLALVVVVAVCTKDADRRNAAIDVLCILLRRPYRGVDRDPARRGGVTRRRSRRALGRRG